MNEVGTSQAIQTALSDVKHILQEPDQAGRKATSKLKAEIVAKKKAFNKAAKASFAAEFASAAEFHGGDSPPSAEFASGGNSRSSLSAWSNGLSPPDLYEWFTNCYQMRCDDDYAYGGCHLHGPYDPEATPSSTRRDFLVFCLLAHRRHVVPPSWDWAACLRVAANFACYAMEKSDAQDRWGGENYFSSAMGGRSLRATACDVYGQGAEALTYQGISEEETKAHDDVGEWEATGRPAAAAAFHDHVGGVVAWQRFESDLAQKMGWQDEGAG